MKHLVNITFGICLTEEEEEELKEADDKNAYWKEMLFYHSFGKFVRAEEIHEISRSSSEDSRLPEEV